MLESVLKQRVNIQVCILNESSATRSDLEECRGKSKHCRRKAILSKHSSWRELRRSHAAARRLEICHVGWLRGTSYTGVIPTQTKEGVPGLFFTRALLRRPFPSRARSFRL
jgi:hypothetical protein